MAEIGPYLILLLGPLLWDAVRRFFNEKKAAREFESYVGSQCVTKLDALTEELQSLKLTMVSQDEKRSAALKNGLVEFREIINFTDEQRKALQQKVVTKALDQSSRR